MANGTVTYISPAWGLIPTQDEMARKFHAVHVQVKFDEDSPSIEVVHNLNLPYGGPLQEPQWIVPVVVVNAISGGIGAPRHTIRVKDGNVLEIGRVATGPGTALTLDVWIYRQQADSFWFFRL
jgi:hypothetical protein